MPDTESRTQRFRGRSPPDRPDWTVQTVARRSTNREETATCVATGQPVALDGVHYLATLTHEMPGRQPEVYDRLVVADGALGVFDEWLEGGEE